VANRIHVYIIGGFGGSGRFAFSVYGCIVYATPEATVPHPDASQAYFTHNIHRSENVVRSTYTHATAVDNTPRRVTAVTIPYINNAVKKKNGIVTAL
jgi:hypothetical protein